MAKSNHENSIFLFWKMLFWLCLKIFDLLALEYVRYALTGVSVAVGVARVAHSVVFFFIGKQSLESVVNNLLVGADKLERARLDALGTLGGVTHDKHRFAQSGSLFLNATAIGQNDIGLLHEEYETEVLERLDKEKVTQIAQILAKNLVDWLSHIGVEVHGINEINIGISFAEGLDGSADVKETIAKVLATMSGDENQTAFAVKTVDIISGTTQFIGKTRTHRLV